VEDGYEFYGNSRRLVTIFSAPNYCNEFDNSAAAMVVDKSLCCKFLKFYSPKLGPETNNKVSSNRHMVGSGKY